MKKDEKRFCKLLLFLSLVSQFKHAIFHRFFCRILLLPLVQPWGLFQFYKLFLYLLNFKAFVGFRSV